MAAPLQNLSRRLRDLGLRPTDDFGKAVAFAAAGQAHRADRDPATPPTVTRTTALIGASYGDAEVRELGLKGGIEWERLAEGADLYDWVPPSDATPQFDAVVHERVLEALDRYAEHYSEREVIDALGLAWSLIEAGEGTFLKRIADSGGRVDDLEKIWGEALAYRSSSEMGEIEVPPPTTTPPDTPRVWVTTGRPDAPQPVDLEDIKAGEKMPWMVPAAVRANDYVLLWVAGGTGFRYVTRALTDAEVQTIRGRTAPVAELQVEHVIENPIPFGALVDDPVLGSWGLVRRKMQGAVRAQPTPLNEDAELWPAFADLVVGTNPGLSSWVVEVLTPAPDERTHIDWVSDAAATVDSLHRRPLAADLAKRLDRILETATPAEGEHTSFLVHIDGPWGSGKSTLLNFVREELNDRNWLVVDFNAWRQSGIGPPWWTLFSALREAHRCDLGPLTRSRLTIREMWRRVRVAGSPVAVVATVVTVALLLAYWIADPGWRWATVTDAAAVVGAAVSLGGVLIAGTRLVRRYLVWGTAGGASRLDEIHTDPVAKIREYFKWYLGLVKKPVAYLIDDLDRCDTEYVVDLLESVQTLMRDADTAAGAEDRTKGKRPAADAEDPTKVKGPYFVVAADGRWIRSSFDEKFGKFSDYVGEPGRPLGYLFLDKIFQLTIQVPTLSPSWQDEYLRDLLRVGAQPDEELLSEERSLREELVRATSDAEVFAATDRASPMVQARVSGAVLEKLSEPEVETRRRHALSKFARLLDRNPRSMKRFVNTYSVLQGVLYISHTRVPPDVLALWSIIQTRWPLLAAYLRSHPESVSLWADGDEPPDLDEPLKKLVGDSDVAEVLKFPVGGPLSAAHIRQCCGMDAE